jgi:hypothetical protein
VRRCVKGALIGADRAHLEGDYASRELVVELERLDRATSLELVEPATDAVRRAAESIAQLPRIAVMVAVREHCECADGRPGGADSVAVEKISSKAWLNFVPRSWMRNWKDC